MNLSEATRWAERVRDAIHPYCERVEIAGSIRRQKPDGIKDLELVIIPRWQEVKGGEFIASLFSEIADAPKLMRNVTHAWALEMDQIGMIQWIKPGVPGRIPWEPKPEGKYWRGMVNPGPLHQPEIKLDLFLATPENFGLIYLIRTGSAEFSEAVVTHAKRIGMPCAGGALHRDGAPVATCEEADVFSALRLEWVNPQDRHGRAQLRARREAVTQ